MRCTGKDRQIKLGRNHLRGLQGKAIPAMKFQVYAKMNGCEAGIFYCDTDNIKDGKNTDESACRRRYDQVHAEVESGLKDTQGSSWTGIPMIAMKMIESWLLADENAYKEYYVFTPENPGLPAKPELIWGAKDNDKSNYPKHYMSRVLAQFDEEADRNLFIEIAKNMDVDTLAAKCPISFATFQKEFKYYVDRL